MDEQDLFLNKDEPLDMPLLQTEVLRMEIWRMFKTLPEIGQTRENYAKICKNYYDKLKPKKQ